MKNTPVNWKVVDPQIRAAYRTNTKGAILQLAERIGVHRATLGRRAVVIGIREVGQRIFEYSDAETKFMIRHYPTPLHELQKMMVAKGFRKWNLESLSNRYYLLREKGLLHNLYDELADRDLYAIAEISELFGIGEAQVRNWIKNQWLKTTYPSSRENPVYIQPIKRKDLHEFMKNNPSKWDSRKCNHLWMVDILTSPSSEDKIEIVRQDFAGIDERKVPYMKQA